MNRLNLFFLNCGVLLFVCSALDAQSSEWSIAGSTPGSYPTCMEGFARPPLALPFQGRDYAVCNDFVIVAA